MRRGRASPGKSKLKGMNPLAPPNVKSKGAVSPRTFENPRRAPERRPLLAIFMDTWKDVLAGDIPIEYAASLYFLGTERKEEEKYEVRYGIATMERAKEAASKEK